MLGCLQDHIGLTSPPVTETRYCWQVNFEYGKFNSIVSARDVLRTIAVPVMPDQEQAMPGFWSCMEWRLLFASGRAPLLISVRDGSSTRPFDQDRQHDE